MSVIDVHLSVFCPEGEEAIAQAQLRERVPVLPSEPESLGRVDYEALAEKIEEMVNDSLGRIVGQLDLLARFHRAKRGDDGSRGTANGPVNAGSFSLSRPRSGGDR